MKPNPLPSGLLRSKRWEWHIPSERTADTVRSLVLSAPHLVKTTPVRAVYHCGDYFLKFERATGWMTSFRNWLHPKARAEYETGLDLAAAGVPAVECLGWGRHGGTNVLITRAIPGVMTVEQFFYDRIVYGGGELAWSAEFMQSLAVVTGSAALIPVAAFAFMTFQLLCAPCFAAMGAIKREMGGFNKWFWAAIGWECGWAYAIALIVFQVGKFVVTGAFGIGTAVALVLIALILFGLFRPMPRQAEGEAAPVLAVEAGE